MSESQLSLYNKALRHLGERKLASTSEDQESRYYLDDEYAHALDFCLRCGFWNFALRAVQIDADVTAPNFGYTNKFTKPVDWVKTYRISASEFFDPPLFDYQDHDGYWLASLTPLYFMYVSNIRGLTVSLFPADYAEYVGAYLAYTIYRRITGKGLDEMVAFEKSVVQKALKVAQANDAMDQSPEKSPWGTWVTSRSRRGSQTMFPYSY